MSAPPMSSDQAQGPRIWRWALGVGAVVVVLLAAVALRPPEGARVSVARAARSDLVVPVLCDGNLEPPPGGEVRAPEAAVVATIPARDGERVSRGTALVRLDAPDLTQSALRARAAALELSEEQARATADLEEARRAAAHAHEVAQASARLLAQAAVSRASAESDQLADRQAQDRLRAAQARLDGIAGAGHASRLALSQEEARRLEERVAALTLRAPLDGVAYGLPRKTGETVAAGQLVASVADPLHLRVRARVDQPDLPRIEVGQRFLVSFDGLPDRRWEGKVLSVSAGVRETGGREVGEVVGEIADPGAKLPPNASVNAQIVVGERRGVLTIPRAAMLRDGDRRYVYSLEGGRARRRDIAIGLVGLNDVEVASGLAENDRVIVPGMSAVTEGMRVSENRSAQK